MYITKNNMPPVTVPAAIAATMLITPNMLAKSSNHHAHAWVLYKAYNRIMSKTIISIVYLTVSIGSVWSGCVMPKIDAISHSRWRVTKPSITNTVGLFRFTAILAPILEKLKNVYIISRP